MEKLRYLGFWILSPSRMLFDIWKKRTGDRTEFHRKWSRRFLVGELLAAGFIIVATLAFPDLRNCYAFSILLLAVAWSRINELAFAFYNDAFSKLGRKESASGLLPAERALMALRSYIGLIIYFSIAYYFIWIQTPFKPEFGSYFDSLYFSAVTIATLGYGDFVATHWLTKALSIYQVLLGLLLIVVAIGTYIGHASDEKSGKSA